MAQESGGNLLVWRVLVLVGVAGGLIGVFGEIYELSLVSVPLAIISLVLLNVNRRKHSSPTAPAPKKPAETDQERMRGDQILRSWLTAAQAGDPEAKAKLAEALGKAGRNDVDGVDSVPALRRLGIGPEDFGNTQAPQNTPTD
jgi:hypothetical protein